MNEDLQDLVRRMFAILDIVETTDEGREFRPTTISSCRCMDAQKLEVILERMKAIVQYVPKEELTYYK